MLSVGMRLVMESRLRECHSESSKLHTMVQLLEAEDSKSLSMADVSSRSLKLIDFNADIQTTHTEMAAQVHLDQPQPLARRKSIHTFRMGVKLAVDVQETSTSPTRTRRTPLFPTHPNT
jgi:hypothetical protein